MPSDHGQSPMQLADRGVDTTGSAEKNTGRPVQWATSARVGLPVPVGLLRQHGPSTATRHAERLGVNAWRDTFDMSDWALRLTTAEAPALRQELRAVIAGYRRDTPEAAASAPAGAERVVVATHLLPELDASAPSATCSSSQEATVTETS
ncbi:hypothetical protein [Streptomyces misionensis]|uniref:hypothetical protein n=1 Tax=Streptomyces misionensis TaxID=67331 RepID=UPI0033E7AA6E